MKKSDFATNKGGIIKAPDKSVTKDSPKSKVVKGSDLRTGTKKSK